MLRKEETITPGRQVADYKIRKTLQGEELVYNTKAVNATRRALPLKNLAAAPPV